MAEKVSRIDNNGVNELKNCIRGPLYLIRELLKEEPTIEYEEKYAPYVDEIFGFVDYVIKEWDIRTDDDSFDTL